MFSCSLWHLYKYNISKWHVCIEWRTSRRAGVQVQIPDVGGVRVVLEAPGLRVEDGLAVQVEPAAHLAEALLEDGHYAPVGGGAHIEQQVAAARDHLHEVRHELLGRQHVRERHLAPEAPRLAVHRHARLPLVRQQVARQVAVPTRVEVAVPAAHAVAPAVVRDHCLPNGTLHTDNDNDNDNVYAQWLSLTASKPLQMLSIHRCRAMR